MSFEKKVAADLREMDRPDGMVYPPDGWCLLNYFEYLKVIRQRDAALDGDWVARPAYDQTMAELRSAHAALRSVSKWMDGLAPDNEPLHDMVDAVLSSGSQLADATPNPPASP